MERRNDDNLELTCDDVGSSMEFFSLLACRRTMRPGTIGDSWRRKPGGQANECELSIEPRTGHATIVSGVAYD